MHQFSTFEDKTQVDEWDIFVSVTLYKYVYQFTANWWLRTYSVMQSVGNSICGDVVSDSFTMVYRDEDSIQDKEYEKQIFWDLYTEDFKS